MLSLWLSRPPPQPPSKIEPARSERSRSRGRLGDASEDWSEGFMRGMYILYMLTCLVFAVLCAHALVEGTR